MTDRLLCHCKQLLRITRHIRVNFVIKFHFLEEEGMALMLESFRKQLGQYGNKIYQNFAFNDNIIFSVKFI